MTLTAWFFLMLAVCFFAAGWYLNAKNEKIEEENDRLRGCLLREHCIAQELKKELEKANAKSRAFFDFEKVNKNKEK